MAFDGITIAAMVQELHQNLDGGRFNKIAQPEADALMITGKGANGQCRLLLSANASLPLIYFTDKNKVPASAVSTSPAWNELWNLDWSIAMKWETPVRNF